MAELKPCPFCGGEVSLSKASDGTTLWWFVGRGRGHRPCRCRLFMESDSFVPTTPQEEKQLIKARLIEAWNRRAADD